MSATAKLTPLMPTRAPRNSLRRCTRAASASSRGSSERSGGASGSVRANRARICSRFLWIAGTRMCDGVSSAELDDELGQVGLPGPDAALLQSLVEPGLLGRQRLGLDHLVDAVGGDDVADDPVALLCVARPVHDAAGLLDRRLELRRGSSSRWRSTRSLSARPASRSPSQSGTSATAAARLARMVWVAWPRLWRSWVSASATRAAWGNGTASPALASVIPTPRSWSGPGSRPGASCAPRSAGATGRRRCA